VRAIAISALWVGYAVDARYGAGAPSPPTSVRWRDKQHYLHFAALSICLTAKAVRAKGKAIRRNHNLASPVVLLP